MFADNQYLHIINVCGWIIFADNQYLHIINVCGWIIFADDCKYGYLGFWPAADCNCRGFRYELSKCKVIS